jgi:hypothetical protein
MPSNAPESIAASNAESAMVDNKSDVDSDVIDGTSWFFI